MSRDDPCVVLDDARALVTRAPSGDKQLIVHPGAYHAIGRLFVEAPYRARVYRTFMAFLSSRSGMSRR